MSEKGWLVNNNPQAMLELLWHKPYPGYKLSLRKTRLFTAASFRYLLYPADRTTNQKQYAAITALERLADDQDEDGLFEAWSQSGLPRPGIAIGTVAGARMHATQCAEYRMADMRQYQCDVLRDIFGNPYRPVDIVDVLPDWLCWNGGAVFWLSRAAYEERPGWQPGCMSCKGSLKERVDELMEGGFLGDGIGPGNASRRINHESGMSLSPEEVHFIWQQGKPWHKGRCKCHIEDGTLDPDRLAVLADALEEAGCQNGLILRHLRGEEPCPRCAIGGRDPFTGTDSNCGLCLGTGWTRLLGPHLRGCFVLDLLLGRE